LYASSDTGATWATVNNPGVNDLLDIQKADASTAYAVGLGGTFIKSTDAGITWFMKTPPAADNLLRVYFTSTTSGTILSATGSLFTTNDGGETWNSEIVSLKALKSGNITDASLKSTGFYVTTFDGTRSHTYVSSDNGSTWHEEFYTVGALSDVITNGSSYLAAGPVTMLLPQDAATKNFTITRTDLTTGISKISKQYGYTAVTTDGAVYTGTTDGTQWTQAVPPATAVNKLVSVNGKNVAASATQIGQSTNWAIFATPTALGSNTIVNLRYVNNYLAVTATNNVLLVKDTTTTFASTTGWTQLNFVFAPVGRTIKDAWHGSANTNNWITLMDNGALYTATQAGTNLTFNLFPLFAPTNVQRFINKDNSELFVINSAGTIYKSTDAVNFTTVTTLPLAYGQLNGITLSTQSGLVKGVAVFADGSIYEYNGTSWIVRNLQAAQQNTIADNGSTYTAGNNGELYKRQSGKWVYQPHVTQGLTFVEANITADNTLRVATANDVYVYISSALTKENATAFTGTITRMDNDVNRVIAVTQSGSTNSNAGSAWQQDFNAGTALYAVDAVSGGADITAGAAGKVFNKNSGSWSASNAEQVQLLYATAADGSNAVAVGKQGTIITSADRGDSWTWRYSGTTGNLKTVALRGTTAIAGADNGYVTTSTNTGITWQAKSISASAINAVGVSNAALLAVSGNKVYKSTNSGTSYAVDLTMSAGVQVNSMTLDADGYGFIVGNAGLAYRVTPMGYTLVNTDANTSDDKGSGIAAVDLKSVTFSSRDTGYISEANGIVIKTTDGGLHWKQEQNGGSSSPLVAMGSTQKGTLVDGSGTVNKLRDIVSNYSTRNWYDEIGRLVLSQNAKQFYIENYLTVAQKNEVTGTGTIRAYSYTLFDDIGRITEVGELLTRAAVPTFKHETQVQYSTFTSSFIPTGVEREITKTYYDRVQFTNIYVGFTQENLRPRVSSVTYQDKAGAAYDRATHFSYDSHGSVKILIQEINASGTTLKKRLDYEYDLVSGKVNFFYYQKGQPDQLIHKYEYDGDNRVVKVYTSRDGITWDRDAKYDYMAHGPLARTTIGEKEVEQNNFSYTVQGWIKGVNGNNFSYALGYFDDGTYKDYQSITNINTNLATPINSTRSLFNGNIATMTSNTPQFANQGGAIWTQQFEYDQLDRIMASATVGGTNPNSFKTSYTYDAGGNITNLKRFDIAGVQYDNMQYIYQNVQNDYNKNTNKLRYVNDDVAFTNVSKTDIDDQNIDNYQYDDIGNLIYDKQKEIQNIEWTMYGKIRKVTRTATSTKSDLEFAYNTNGKRVTKIVTDKTGNVKTTYYLYDPQGNLLSIYENDNSNPLSLTEQYVYGPSPLGVIKPTYTSDKEIHITGQKEYGIMDHLQTQRLTLDDKGVVIGAFDPLPFGLSARSYNITNQRNTFNGKEDDRELDGWQNYGEREYDENTCRFVSVDPLTKSYPWYSPYQFAGNKPIWATDLDGLEEDKTAGIPQIDPEAMFYGALAQWLDAAVNLFNFEAEATVGAKKQETSTTSTKYQNTSTVGYSGWDVFKPAPYSPGGGGAPAPKITLSNESSVIKTTEKQTPTGTQTQTSSNTGERTTSSTVKYSGTDRNKGTYSFSYTSSQSNTKGTSNTYQATYGIPGAYFFGQQTYTYPSGSNYGQSKTSLGVKVEGETPSVGGWSLFGEAKSEISIVQTVKK